MKSFLAIGTLLIALMLSTVPQKAQAQNLMPTLTRITSSTVSGDAVVFEDTVNQVSYVYKKGAFKSKHIKYSSGVILFKELGKNGDVIWKGPISGVKISVSGYATDSLKTVFVRKYLSN